LSTARCKDPLRATRPRRPGYPESAMPE
jgi:hypothetical protein